MDLADQAVISSGGASGLGEAATVPLPPLAGDDPIDLLTPDACARAPEFFDRIRERDPITWSARHRAWIITGHPELDEAFRDRRLSTERMDAFRARLSDRRAAALSAAIDLLDGWMLFHEPPTHTRLRSPLNRSFTPKAVGGLASRVETLVERHLDEMAADAERNGGLTDVVESFAHPLPAAVIAELFGVPEAERGWLPEWSEKFGVVVFGAVGRPDYEQVAREAGEELEREIGGLIERYRREPEDNLLSLLLSREGADDGLSTVEILGACSILLFAGHDTTSSFTGSALLSLLAHPEQAGLLRKGAVDLEVAVEELLRLDAPAKAMMRTVAETHARAGHVFEAGQAVFMGIVGANRDPRVFDEPAELQLDRTPNPHLTFGHGHHFCLGAALARLEVRTALPAMLRRFPNLAVAGEVTWKASISDRSAASIPVSLW
jgi:cytochrome P450